MPIRSSRPAKKVNYTIRKLKTKGETTRNSYSDDYWREKRLTGGKKRGS